MESHWFDVVRAKVYKQDQLQAFSSAANSEYEI